MQPSIINTDGFTTSVLYVGGVGGGELLTHLPVVGYLTYLLLSYVPSCAGYEQAE